MKTYSIIGAVGFGLFTLVVVCARGQAPKQMEPAPIADGSVLTPHEASYAEPHMLSRGVDWHHFPNADLWATYCEEKGACGQRSPYRQWHPLSALCGMFKLPSFGKCNCSHCTSCSSRAHKSRDLFSELFGERSQCGCPKCRGGYAYHEQAPKPAVNPDPPLAPVPPAPAPALQMPPEPAPAPVTLAPVDEDPAPVPPTYLEPVVEPPVDPIPQNAVPEAAPQTDKPEIPRNEIPASETNGSSRRPRTKFAGFRLSDYIKTD
jgi:hypothetical protein